MGEKLRWGVLSTAKIGRKSVIPAIRESSNGVVTAIASRDPRAAEEAARALDIPHALSSYEALLESREVDAVYIPLPNNMHKEWTIRAAEHGKHILCEKPFALNAAEVEEMIAAARAHRVLLAEAFMYRFHPQFDRLQALIGDGTLGSVQIIRSAFCFLLEDFTNIRMRPELGGGALMDVGCYCVNMSRLVAGREPIQVQANAVIGEKSGVDETFAAILRFPEDVIAHFDCSFRTDYREWLQVQGTRARADIPRPIKPGSRPGEIVLQRGETADVTGMSNVITTGAANHYRLMVEDFGNAVLQAKPLRYPPEEGLANMRVIDALYESARSRKAVEIRD
jgi:xylose dehydrogenase (NAD/NADP)